MEKKIFNFNFLLSNLLNFLHFILEILVYYYELSEKKKKSNYDIDFYRNTITFLLVFVFQ